MKLILMLNIVLLFKTDIFFRQGNTVDFTVLRVIKNIQERVIIIILSTI